MSKLVRIEGLMHLAAYAATFFCALGVANAATDGLSCNDVKDTEAVLFCLSELDGLVATGDIQEASKSIVRLEGAIVGARNDVAASQSIARLIDTADVYRLYFSGRIEYIKGNSEKSVEYFSLGKNISRERSVEAQAYLMNMANLLRIYSERDDIITRRQLITELEQIFASATKAPFGLLLSLMNRRLLYYSDTSDCVHAKIASEPVTRIAREQMVDQRSIDFYMASASSLIAHACNDLNDAEVRARAALDIAEKHDDFIGPFVPILYANMSNYYSRHDNREVAETMLNKSYEAALRFSCDADGSIRRGLKRRATLINR